MNIADKLTTIAENEPKVFKAGQLAMLKESKYMHPTISGAVISVNDVSPIEHNLRVKLTSKNLFDADTVLPALTNENFPDWHWTKQEDGSFYLGNIGTLVGCIWFENTTGYNGQFSFSITTKANNGTGELNTLNIIFTYTDGSKERLGMRDMLDYTTYTFVTNANKTLSHIYQTYNDIASTYIKDIMIAYGTDTTYAPYMTDFEGIEVKQIGKNLITLNYQQMAQSSDTFSIVTNDDGTITVNGTGMSSHFLGSNEYYKPALKHGVTYRMSGISSNYGAIIIKAKASDGTAKYFNSIYSFVWDNDYTFVSIYILFVSGITLDNYLIKPQLEVGEVATEYETPTNRDNIVTANANADGTVEGLTSLSPNMTLYTDNDGAIVNCQYYRDIDLYIDNLITDIALTGGE